VELVSSSDRPLRQIARELGVNHETLRSWVNKAKEEAAAPAEDPGESAEVRALRRRVAELEKEKEILRKAAELPPVRRTRRVWGQAVSFGGVWRASNVTGACIPMLECRRLGLYQHSIHSNIALASSSRVFHCLMSSSSSCRVPQKDSIMALS
jgi:transposase